MAVLKNESKVTLARFLYSEQLDPLLQLSFLRFSIIWLKP